MILHFFLTCPLYLIENKNGYDELLLSEISIRESSALLEKGKLGIPCNPEEWINAALDTAKLRSVHPNPVIAYRSAVLPRAFHEDPADQIIAARAREENAGPF